MTMLRSLPVLGVLFAAHIALAAGADSDVVARLGTTDIPASALKIFVQTLDPKVRRQAAGDPALMARLVRAELARIAVLKEARAQKWEQRPDVIAEIERVRDEAISSSYLKSVSAPPAGYPSEAEIQSAYDLNRDALMAPRQYRLSQIFVGLPAGGNAGAEDAVRQKADDLAAKAKTKGADFAALVKANADMKNGAEQDGDLGWASEAELVPEIRAQVAGMTQGEVSDPIRTTSGWHIIRMDDTKPAAPRPLAEVHDQLAAALRQRKAQANEQAYLAGLMTKSPAAINEIEIKKIFENTQ
jgi:parvulin-like peptidyl-prolyl isomerase